MALVQGKLKDAILRTGGMAGRITMIRGVPVVWRGPCAPADRVCARCNRIYINGRWTAMHPAGRHISHDICSECRDAVMSGVRAGAGRQMAG